MTKEIIDFDIEAEEFYKIEENLSFKMLQYDKAIKINDLKLKNSIE